MYIVNHNRKALDRYKSVFNKPAMRSMRIAIFDFHTFIFIFIYVSKTL